MAKSNAVIAKPVRPSVLPKADTEKNQPTGERLNLVLDKISKHGIESLTSEELAVLKEMSRKLGGSEPN